METEANQVTGIPPVPSEIKDTNEKVMALTVKSWDEIGALKSEIVSSIMAKQACILSKRFAFANNDDNGRSRKRHKTDSRRTTAETNKTEGDQTRESGIVTSDEGSAVDSFVDSHRTEESSMEDDLESERQIDRLGRVSRLMIQLEYFHQELRNEIAAISQEFDIDS